MFIAVEPEPNTEALETSTVKVLIPPESAFETYANPLFNTMFLPKAPVSVEAIVTSVALFLVRVILDPAVNCTTELSVPDVEVKFKSTLLPSCVAFKSYFSSVFVV